LRIVIRRLGEILMRLRDENKKVPLSLHRQNSGVAISLRRHTSLFDNHLSVSCMRSRMSALRSTDTPSPLDS
jgi:hypothetical protein